MKHDLKITLFLIALFMLAQVVGLALLKASLKETVDDSGNRVVVFDEEKVGEVPRMSGLVFLLYVLVGVGVGTVLVLLLIKFRKANLWRAWFFFAVFVAMEFALKTLMPAAVAIVIALALAVWKIYKPNILVHNLTEVLMYSGIAIFLVPLLNSMNNSTILGIPGNIFWAAALLVMISVYDFIAVFKSKHMVSMAQFQTQSKVFAGLLIPYKVKVSGQQAPPPALQKMQAMGSQKKAKLPRGTDQLPELTIPVDSGNRTAILGGGDIAFPLLFSGTVLYQLANVMQVQAALMQTLIITLTTTAALSLLFFFAKKEKFYPAMPVITIGCFVGYLIVFFL